MFFEPDSFLERDPADAETPQEATRLEREAGQRARLCEAMVAVAAQRGYEETRAHQVFGVAEIGSGTFRKLFASKEACFQAAFEACARLVSRRIETGLEGIKGTPLRTEAGLRALVEVLAEEPDLARMVVVEARAGGMASREAQLQWLDRLAGIFGGEDVDAEAAWLARMGLRAAMAIIALEVAAGRTEILPNLPGELVGAALAACRTLEA